MMIAAPLIYWRSRTRSARLAFATPEDGREPMPSADLVGDRPITGSARDYADPNWAAVGLVAAAKEDSNVTDTVAE